MKDYEAGKRRPIQNNLDAGELTAICKAALAEQGPMDTRQLSHHVMHTKGFNEADNELRKERSGSFRRSQCSASAV